MIDKKKKKERLLKKLKEVEEWTKNGGPFSNWITIFFANPRKWLLKTICFFLLLAPCFVVMLYQGLEWQVKAFFFVIFFPLFFIFLLLELIRWWKKNKKISKSH